MIFFGSRGKVIPGEVMEGIQCPECGHSRFISFGVLRYFHLYWIPTFPVSKKPGIECAHCKNALMDKELSGDLSRHVKSAVFTPKAVLSSFSGLVLIAALLVAAGVVVTQEQNREAAWLQDPAVNDIYVVDLTKVYEDANTKYPYGAMKVAELSGSGVEMQISTIIYDMASGVSDAIDDGEVRTDDYFDASTVFLAFDQLQAMKDNGAIHSIVRP